MRGFQSPEFLTDLYRDLRDRRLLSVALVLVLGIVIVPIALSSSSSSPPPPAAPAAGVTAGASANEITVVANNPGLRDYRKRLKALSKKDPFKQQFTAPPKSARLAPPSPSLAASSGPESTPEPAPSSGGGGSSQATPASSGGALPKVKTITKVRTKTKTKYATYKVKAKVGEAGNLVARESLQTFSLLPSDAVPVLSYVGVSEDAKKAVFMVSSSVLSVTGDGVCLLGLNGCGMLVLKPGQGQQFLWSDGRTYGIELVKIERVLRNKPPSG